MKTFDLSQIEYKRILGRTSVQEKNNALPLFWGGSALEINVHSKEVWAYISTDYTGHEIWLAVEVNGYQTCRFILGKEPAWYCLAKNLNPANENLISIIKDTQPMPDDPNHIMLIHEIGLSDDGTFCPVKPRNCKIEFIGDSITSGEGLAGNWFENDWITQWMCASKTYAVQTAKALNADWFTMGQCGWGICWGWDGNRTTCMPPYYESVCGILKGQKQSENGSTAKYDFGSGSDFVVINLGTNDNSAFNQPAWKDENGNVYVLTKTKDGLASEKDGAVILNTVKQFLKTIRQNNPKAKILWVWGMMKLDIVPSIIKSGIEAYIKETGDSAVYALELDALEDIEKLPEEHGSRGHPGAVTHKKAAEKISGFIKQWLS